MDGRLALRVAAKPRPALTAVARDGDIAGRVEEAVAQFEPGNARSKKVEEPAERP
jgi:hypothetical protein